MQQKYSTHSSKVTTHRLDQSAALAQWEPCERQVSEPKTAVLSHSKQHLNAAANQEGAVSLCWIAVYDWVLTDEEGAKSVGNGGRDIQQQHIRRTVVEQQLHSLEHNALNLWPSKPR